MNIIFIDNYVYFKNHYTLYMYIYIILYNMGERIRSVRTGSIKFTTN